MLFRVHEDTGHLLLSRPLLSSVGVLHSAAQSGLRARDAPLLQSPRSADVAGVRLSKDARGQTSRRAQRRANVIDTWLGPAHVSISWFSQISVEQTD